MRKSLLSMNELLLVDLTPSALFLEAESKDPTDFCEVNNPPRCPREDDKECTRKLLLPRRDLIELLAWRSISKKCTERVEAQRH